MDGAPEPHTSTRGFTLIEIAIVVAIVTMLLTLGLSLVNAQLSSAAVSVTKKRQEAIKDALIAFLGANKRLPCPHVPVGPPTPVNGVETPATTPPPACPAFGVVPFATLGLSRELAEDGWGNLFSYRIYADATPPCPGTGRDWGNPACFGEGKSGALVINDGTVAAPMPLTNNVAAVVVSHGANGLGAWAAQGTRNAAPTTCDEAHNAIGATPLPVGCAPASNTFYKGERQENDDVLSYLPASDALQTLSKQGAIKLAVAKVNDDLQLLFEQAVSANLTSASCVIPATAVRDPWGIQYVLSIPVPPISVLGTYSSTNLPTITKPIERAVLDVYRNRAGAPACP